MNSQLVVERKLLRHITDQSLDFLGLFFNVMARDGRAPFCRFENSAEHADHCRFARTIRAKKSEDRTARNREADVIHRGEMAETPRQVRALDHGLGHVTSIWEY